MFTVVRINSESEQVEWRSAGRQTKGEADTLCEKFNRARDKRDFQEHFFRVDPAPALMEVSDLDVNRG